MFEAKYRGQLWGASDEREVMDVLAAFRATWAQGRRVTGDAEPPEL
ncbi:MAG: hypothetical protein LC808_04810 [Actinobacteria bacterium]|nr:hypothetical protein [Actinomycetota bacterium]